MKAPKITSSRRWSADSVRLACIKNGLYTRGSREDYDHMTNWVDRLYPNSENLYFIACDIQKHSEDQTITNVMFLLERDAVTTTFEIEENDEF